MGFVPCVAQNVMAQAFFRLAERNSADTLVTAYGLGGSGSNQNASWSTSLGQSSDGNLHYFQMDTDLQSAVTGSWFHVTIYWYLSAVVGQIDLGDTTVTPRVLESIVKITNYPYAATGNYLVLGVAALYDNTSFSYTYNNVSSGSDGLSGLYVNVSSVCQVREEQLSDSITLTHERHHFSVGLELLPLLEDFKSPFVRKRLTQPFAICATLFFWPRFLRMPMIPSVR